MPDDQKQLSRKIVARLSRQEVATLRAALENWKEELAEGGDWLSDSIFFIKHAPLISKDVDELSSRLRVLSREDRYARIVRQTSREQSMWKFNCRVPTYVGSLTAEERGSGVGPDFDKPEVPVQVSDSAGVRVILGTHDEQDLSKPEIVIERRRNGWAIFLNSNGSETIGVAYMLDDGRTFLLREMFVDSPIDEVDDEPSQVDRP